jgi:hypothetical protein
VATFPTHRLGAQKVIHSVITAAMKMHSELGLDYSRAPIKTVYITNSTKPVSKPHVKSGFLLSIAA